jgi:hypothetical protein
MKMVFTLALCLIGSVSVAGQEPSGDQKPGAQGSHASCPMHDAHTQMNARGEKGMGFSQTATTHHFFLEPDGGVIQVEAKDSTDTGSRDEVRMHLGYIAKAFQNGNFDIPMFVHSTVPPGVPEMKNLGGTD